MSDLKKAYGWTDEMILEAEKLTYKFRDHQRELIDLLAAVGRENLAVLMNGPIPEGYVKIEDVLVRLKDAWKCEQDALEQVRRLNVIKAVIDQVEVEL